MRRKSSSSSAVNGDQNVGEPLQSPPIKSSGSVISDDGDDSESCVTYKDRRREAHTHAEQRRRDAIKKGYDALVDIVPTCQQSESVSSTKLSKATVLQRSIDYVQFLVQHKKKQEEDLEKKRKEVMALKIMLANYEHIVKATQNTPTAGESEIPEEIKFRVFQQFMDNLFLSFNSSISVNNFAELSACVFNWLEEYCKPQVLKEVMHASAHHASMDYRPQN